MRKLIVFNNVSLDGYFTDANNDMSWAHKSDAESNDFAASNASGKGVLVFGRKTYDLMVKFWPTPQAKQMFPEVAEGMNKSQKIVFSRTMDAPTWDNTRLIKENIVDEMKKLKSESGEGMVIMGSGTIVSQFSEARLIDEYQFLVNPIVLGSGRTLFEGVKEKFGLKQTNLRSFKNGNLFVCYQPEW